MQKLNYTITCEQPVHTGSDKNLGIYRQLRREKIILRNPKEVKSKFREGDRKLKRQAIALLLHRLWKRMPSVSRKTIYDEIASHLISSTSAPTKEQFLNRLCEKLEIRQVTSKEDGMFDVVDILELFDDYELMETIRREHQYIIVVFRKLKDDIKELATATKKVSNRTLFDSDTGELNPIEQIQRELERIQLQEAKPIPGHQQLIDYLPIISGNSIRGYLRRLAMWDFCKLVDITSIEKSLYHQLFTGGNLDSSDGHENLDFRNSYIRMCPMLGLLGSAIGKQTIQGALIVGQAVPLCAEKGTAAQSYHTYLDVMFGTRSDSSKQQAGLKISGASGEEKNQMFYEYEVFAPGTPLKHSFAHRSEDPIVTSAFWRLLKLFIENPFLCAKSSIGNGEVDLSELEALIPQDGDAAYLRYLRENKEAIFNNFQSANTANLVAEDA